MSVLVIARLQRAIRDDERGVALPTVMIFMLAGVLLSLIVSSTVLYSYTFTSSTRSGVQSQAAAEAGIAAARAGMLNGTCVANAGVFEGTDPVYSAQVYRQSPTGSWVEGCPSMAELGRIVADGTAATIGVGGDDTADTSTVEVVLGNAGSPTSLAASGPAIFAYNATGFGGSGTLLSLDGTTPDVMLRTGDVNCNGGSSGAVQLVIKSGNLVAGGSCVIAGNVWVNGNANLSGGARVNGSLTANNVNSTVNVGGNVWANENITLGWSAQIGGWVSGKSLTIAGGTVAGNAWARDGVTTVSGAGINGTLYANGAFNMTGGTVANGQVNGVACHTGGNVSGQIRATTKKTNGGCQNNAKYVQGAAALTVSPTKPASAVVPEWLDFGSEPEHYTAAGWPGSTVYTMGTTCKEPQFLAALQAIGSNPGVIDARACPNGIETFGGSANTYYEDNPQNGHHAWRVRNDLTIIAHKFPLGNGSFNGVSGIQDLWLINPDTIANTVPDCANTGMNMSISGGMKFNNVNVMIYNPCHVNLGSGVAMRGQMFTKSVTVDGNASLTYVPLGLPGYDLSTGLPTSVTVNEWDRPVVTYRNITSG